MAEKLNQALVIRAGLGLTQDKAAEMFGMSTQTWRRFEDGALENEMVTKYLTLAANAMNGWNGDTIELGSPVFLPQVNVMHGVDLPEFAYFGRLSPYSRNIDETYPWRQIINDGRVVKVHVQESESHAAAGEWNAKYTQSSGTLKLVFRVGEQTIYKRGKGQRELLIPVTMLKL